MEIIIGRETDISTLGMGKVPMIFSGGVSLAALGERVIKRILSKSDLYIYIMF